MTWRRFCALLSGLSVNSVLVAKIRNGESGSKRLTNTKIKDPNTIAKLFQGAAKKK